MTETEAKRAEEALTQALLRAPRQFLPLVRAGVHVKKTGFNHQKGLKAWCQERPHLFTVESDTVKAVLNPSLDTETGQDALQIKLVDYLVEFGRPAHLGSHVGQYVNRELKINTSGRLQMFLQSRPDIFRCENQYVSLVNPPGSVKKLLAIPTCPDRDQADTASNSSCDVPPGFQAAPKKGKVLSEVPKARQNSHSDKSLHPLPLRAVPARNFAATPATANGAAAQPVKAVQPVADSNSAAGSEDLIALKAQLQALQIEVDAIRQHLNLPSAASAVAAAATVADAPVERAQTVPSTVPNGRSRFAEGSTRISQDSTKESGGASGQHQQADESPPEECAEDSSRQICVCGGHDSKQWLATAEQFSISKKEWTKLLPLESPISFAAAGSIYNHVYLFGGSDGSKWSKDVRRYVGNGDDQDGWSTVAPMSKIRGSLALSFLGGTFYAIGGGIPSEQYSLVEGYNPITDRWRMLPQGLETPRFALASSVVKGSIVCVGGLKGTEYLDTAETFDPREGRWMTLPSRMSSRRGSFAVCTLGETSLLAIGGFNGSESVASCEVLDLRSGKWRPAASMSAGRAFGGGVAVNADQALAFGGLASNMQNYNTAMEMYSLKDDAWTPFMPAGGPGSLMRAFFSAVAVEQ